MTNFKKIIIVVFAIIAMISIGIFGVVEKIQAKPEIVKSVGYKGFGGFYCIGVGDVPCNY